MDKKNKMQEIIRAVQKLPTLPHVAAKINQLIRSASFDIAELSRIIELDQSIAAKILSLANSAFYGLPRKIINIQEAAVYIGTNTISQLVVSIGVISSFKSGESRYYNRNDFWKHCVGVALISREIAGKDQRHEHPDDVFTAGLMHDIGKVAMDKYCPDLFAEVLKLVSSGEDPFYKVEQEYLGLDHCRIGEWVARNWELPLFIVVGIRHHHEDPEQRRGFSLSHDRVVDIIRIADWAALETGIGNSGSRIAEIPPDSVFERISIDSREALKHAKNINNEVNSAAELLGVS